MIETIESEFIHDGNSENFTSLVIDNSQLGPVLVNFWSRKAGPCLRLYPVLDKLVFGYKGRLLLINVDTEKQLAITKNYGIASVPTLKLFRFGEIEFTLHGYQSDRDLQKKIDQFVSRDSDKIIEKAVHEYTLGNHDVAYKLLSNAIIEDQINPRLPLTICKLLKHEKRFDEALTLFASIPAELRQYREIALLCDELYFLSILSIESSVERVTEETKNLVCIKKLSAQYVIEKQYEQALSELEKIINMDYQFDDGYARVAMLKIFSLIEEHDPLTKKFRPLLLKFTH